MVKVNVDDLIPVSTANSMGVSKLAADAAGRDIFITKGGRPIASMVNFDRYRKLVEFETQQEDLTHTLSSLMHRLFESAEAKPVSSLRDRIKGTSKE